MKKIPALAGCILVLLLPSCTVLVAPMHPNVVTGGRAVAVTRHPANNNEFFVASEGGGIFKSTNAGVNWTQVSGSNTFGFNDVKYCVSNPNIIIAAANTDTKTSNGGGIWRSTNSGSSWTQIPLTPPSPGCATSLSAYCISVEPVNNKIWVGTSCGLAVSTDDGASFSFITPSANYNNETVYAVLTPQQNHIKILTDAGVKVSTNDGVNWSFSTTGLPYVAKGEHAQIACSPLNHEHIFWASNFSPWDGQWHNGIYFSADNGTTWTNLIDNLGINRRPTCYTALSLSGANKFDLYFSDGGCTLKRAAFTNTSPPVISGSWTNLTHPHCDFADLSFKMDGKSPAILAGDGGLFATADNGLNWTFTGGGANGYNALQITEVTGQKHSGDSKSDLYYGTQDNDIHASPDEGATWPNANKMCCEGFFLNVPRESLPAAQTKFTGVDCGPCGNFMTAPLIPAWGPFPNVTNATNAPRLLVPGAYLQSDTLPGAPTVSIFSLTTNNGGSWIPKYAFTNEQRDFSMLGGSVSDPVVFTAVKYAGTTPDGQEVLRMKKIVGVLGGGSPIVSDVGGFGSIGIFPTMFAWYKPYGVNIRDANHIIVPDITTEKVRKTFDGGINWIDDDNLTNLVTNSGAFKFRWGPFTQISNIAFDPDVATRILVGTVQSGICYTCNSGATWTKIAGSEAIPNVSSFYFLGDNKIVASSYGRGLWKLSLPACPKLKIPKFDFQWAEPLIYWKGAYVPIRQIKDPDVCPVCGFFIISRGDITEVNISDANEVTSVSTNGGQIRGFTYEGKDVSMPFRITENAKSFDAGKDENLQALLNTGYKVKGVYMENKMFKGYIMAKEDIQKDQLPKKEVPGVYLSAILDKDSASGKVNGIRLLTRGFDRDARITIAVDGKPADTVLVRTGTDNAGNTVYLLRHLLTPGGHTITVEQKGANGTIREVTTIIVPLNDEKNRKM